MKVLNKNRILCYNIRCIYMSILYLHIRQRRCISPKPSGDLPY